jgi:inorganic triphosphatase YgiF
MAIETELKLRVAPEDLDRLKSHLFLRSLSTCRAKTLKLYSVYFDTPDLQLHHQKMALRLRRVGHQWLQTLKGGGGVNAGLHQRNEWEIRVDSEKLDFQAFEAMGAPPLQDGLRSQVNPLFITDFSRSIRIVKFEGALIEIGLDIGEIRAGKSKHPISEIELELKSGNPLQLFRLALTLLDIAPLEVEQVSKAEYGYRLISPISHYVTKAQNPKPDGKTQVKSALQSMIWSCVFHMQANIPGVINTTNVEYLHQVRVALRRLRVILNMAANIKTDKELASLSVKIAELGTALGRYREWDVFVTEILPSISEENNDDHQTIARECAKHHQLNHKLVYDLLRDRDYQQLILRIGAWMNGEYWNKFIYKNSLLDFAEKILRTYAKKVKQRGLCIQRDKVNNEQLHKLRIACKNLRYSSELLNSIQNHRRNKILVKLQHTLGKLNDSAVALRLLDELNSDVKPEFKIQLIDNIIVSRKMRLKELRKEWKRF